MTGADGRGSDIVLFGTGNFAARILFDLTAVGPPGLSIVVVGRNPARAAWLRTAGMARAAMFGTGVHVTERTLETFSTEQMAALLSGLSPRVVVNTASAQGGRVAARTADGWTRMVEEGGLGTTSILQARISLDVARAVRASSPGAYFVNCCYPDVVNAMISAAGLPIACGIGNVAILAHAFAGLLGPGRGTLQLLAQHAALAAFRRAPAERAGRQPPRVWLDGQELDDVFGRFTAVQLAPEPVIDISGASGVPLFIAMVTGQDWRGHVPGPGGLAGGYPVMLRDGSLQLDLPPGLQQADAIRWNAAFEEQDGVVVGPDGHVRYTGKVHAAIARVSPGLAAGFAIADFAAADQAISELRTRLRSPG